MSSKILSTVKYSSLYTFSNETQLQGRSEWLGLGLELGPGFGLAVF